MKTAIVSCVHGRSYLWEIFKQGLYNLLEVFDADVILCCTDQTECNYFKEFTTINFGNRYLGAKWNAAIYAAYLRKVDYVMMIGSDDVINPEIAEVYKPYMEEGNLIFGMQDFLALNLETDRIKHFKGYPKEYSLPIGAGRMISRQALEKVNGMPAIHIRQKGIDTSISRTLKRHGIQDTVILHPKPLILDIKSADSLTAYDRIKGQEKPANYDWIEQEFKVKIK